MLLLLLLVFLLVFLLLLAVLWSSGRESRTVYVNSTTAYNMRYRISYAVAECYNGTAAYNMRSHKRLKWQTCSSATAPEPEAPPLGPPAPELEPPLDPPPPGSACASSISC